MGKDIKTGKQCTVIIKNCSGKITDRIDIKPIRYHRGPGYRFKMTIRLIKTINRATKKEID